MASLTIAVTLACACSKSKSPTQLLVWVRADAELAASLTQVRVDVRTEAAAEPRGASFNIARGDPKRDEQTFPFSFLVLPGTSENVELVARGFATRSPEAQPIAEQRTVASFDPGRTIELMLQLRPLAPVCNAAADGGDCAPSDNDVPKSSSDAGLQPSAAGHNDHDDHDAGPEVAPCQRALGGRACDPVAQCGCGAPAHCQLDLDDVVCTSPGQAAYGGLCSKNRDCGYGLSCALGVCRSACRDDSDCRNQSSQTAQCVRRRADFSFGVCTEPCAQPGASGCGKGLLCSPIEVAGKQSNYCLRLENPCGSTDDKICDEPGSGGSGFCAADTDMNDCCSRKQSFDSCNAITSCGCSEDMACRVVGRSGDTADTACGKIGNRPIGARCDADEQCVKGSDCTNLICKRLCGDAPEAQCQTGEKCLKYMFSGVQVTDVGNCWITCTPETASDCAAGTVCAHYPTGMFCYVQPATCPASLLNNGTCDETQTLLCAPGTDSDADCGR